MFGAAKWTKNADLDQYGYSGYDIGFDAGSDFSIKSEFGKNFIIFSVDNSSSVHVDKSKRIYLSSWLRSNTKIR